jgi:hypothetical protein
MNRQNLEQLVKQALCALLSGHCRCRRCPDRHLTDQLKEGTN